MISHHLIGTGMASAELGCAAGQPNELLERVARLVTGSGLGVVGRQAVPFPGGGLTLVWILAESHLVLHYWPEEATATIDLHVCDYRRSNAERARELAARLAELLFVAGTERWQDLEVGRPLPATGSASGG